VHGEQRHEDGRHQQDVDHVEAADDGRPRELPADSSDAKPGAPHRDRQHDVVRDPQPRSPTAGRRRGVAGEAVHDGEDHHEDADDPVELPRRRKAPVKNTRHRWPTVDATNTSAAQWCIWRRTRPARTSKLMSSALA
jgi:hypothetical protein